jgi:hypothetical protein
MDCSITDLVVRAKLQIRKASREIVGVNGIWSHEGTRRVQALHQVTDCAYKHAKEALSSGFEREVLLHGLWFAPKEGLILDLGTGVMGPSASWNGHSV